MEQNQSASVKGEFLSDVKRCGVMWFNSKVRTLTDLVSYSSFVQAHGDSLTTNVGVNFVDYVEDLQAFASFTNTSNWRLVDIQGYNVLVPVAGDSYLAGKYVQGELDGCSESYPLDKRGRTQCPVCLNLHELTRSCLTCHTRQGELGMVLMDVDVPLYVSESVGKSLLLMGHNNLTWGPDGLVRWWLVLKVGLYVFLSSAVTREDRLSYLCNRSQGLAMIAASLVDQTSYPYGARLSTSMMRDLVKCEGARIGSTLFYMKVMKKVSSTGDISFGTSFNCLSDRDASLGDCVGQAEVVDLFAMTRTAASLLLTGDDYHKAWFKWNSGVFMNDGFFLQFRNDRYALQLKALGVYISRKGVVDLLDEVPLSAPPKIVRFKDIIFDVPKLTSSELDVPDSCGELNVVEDIERLTMDVDTESSIMEEGCDWMAFESSDVAADELVISDRIISGAIKDVEDVLLDEDETLIGESVLSEDFTASDVETAYRYAEVDSVSDSSSVERHGGEGLLQATDRELVLYEEVKIPDELLALKVSDGGVIDDVVDCIRQGIIKCFHKDGSLAVVSDDIVDKIDEFIRRVFGRILNDVAVRAEWGVDIRLNSEWFLGLPVVDTAYRWSVTLSCMVPKGEENVSEVGCIAYSKYVANIVVLADFVLSLGFDFDIPGDFSIDLCQSVNYVAQGVRVRTLDFTQILANAELSRNVGVPELVNRMMAAALVANKVDYAVAVLSWWGIHCSNRKYLIKCDMVGDDVVLFSRISSFEVERAKHAVKLDYQSGLYTATCDGVEFVGEKASDVVKAHYGFVKVKMKGFNESVYLSSVVDNSKVQCIRI